MAKYYYGTYHKSSFYGGSITGLNLITCENYIVIPSKIKKYVLHWYHTYLLHPGMDITEEMILRHFTELSSDMPSGRNYLIVTLATIKNYQIKKYGKLPVKEAG